MKRGFLNQGSKKSSASASSKATKDDAAKKADGGAAAASSSSAAAPVAVSSKKIQNDAASKADASVVVKDVGSQSPAPTEGDEKICRFCFDDESEGELISPCNCSGGQKWVHLKCLRRWQRSVLVSQPTHPDFYDDDIRQKKCNVCASQFTCKPPTRYELMTSFTGAELAAYVEPRSVIVSHKDFSEELKRQLAGYPPSMKDEIPTSHWVDGVYLIVSVQEDRANEVKLMVNRKPEIDMFVSKLDENFQWDFRGRKYQICFDSEPFEDPVAEFREARMSALDALTTPAVLTLRPVDVDDCGEDGIIAVNLTRPFVLEPKQHIMKVLYLAGKQAALKKTKVVKGGKLMKGVKVSNWRGGPCEEDRPQFAIVLWPGQQGYFMNEDIDLAMLFAHKKALELNTSGDEENVASASAAQPAASSSTAPAANAQPQASSSSAAAASADKSSTKKSSEPASSDAQASGSSAAKKDSSSKDSSDQADTTSDKNSSKQEGETGEVKKDDTAPSSAEKPKKKKRRVGEGDSGSGSGSASESESGADLQRLLNKAMTGGSDSDDEDDEEEESEDGKATKLKKCFEEEEEREKLFAESFVECNIPHSRNKVTQVELRLYWGVAGWSRTQLMGELARGSWGLCRSKAEDIHTKHSELYELMYPRACFPPKSEMTEDYAGGSRAETDAIRALILTRQFRRRMAQQERQSQVLQRVIQNARSNEEDPAEGVVQILEEAAAVSVESSELEESESDENDAEEIVATGGTDESASEAQETSNADSGEVQQAFQALVEQRRADVDAARAVGDRDAAVSAAAQAGAAAAAAMMARNDLGGDEEDDKEDDW